jgi:PAS domain S-box-containing protein
VLVAPGWTLQTSGGLHVTNPYPLHTLAFVVITTILVLSSHALRRSRRRLVTERQDFAAQLSYQAYLLDHVNDAVCVIDRDQRITHWNRGADALYGWTAAEAVGQPMAELVRTALSPDDRRSRLAAVDAGARPRVELLHHNRAGEPIYVEANVSALYGIDGTIDGYITINRDVTARKQYEQELRLLSTTLEDRVQERTAELERSNHELDQFAYVASHDLKSPLRSIALLAEWIAEDAGPTLSPQ